MMKRECKDCFELLGPYLDRELDDARRKRVQGHLESCPDCRKELAALEALHKLVKEKDTGPRLAGDYWDWHRHQVWKRIRAGRRPERQPAAKQGFYWFRLGVVAAGVAVVLIVAVGGWRLMQTQTASRHAEPTMLAGDLEKEARTADHARGLARGTTEVEVTTGLGGGRTQVAAKLPAPAAGAGTSLDRDESMELAGKATAATKGFVAGEEATTAEEVGAARVGATGRVMADAEVAAAQTKAAPPTTAVSLADSLQGMVAVVCEKSPAIIEIDDLPTVSTEDTATVVLRALVELDGSVSRVEVERSSGVKLLDTIAFYNVQRARFVPGVQEGKNVRCWVEVPQSFEAESKTTEEVDSSDKSDK